MDPRTALSEGFAGHRVLVLGDVMLDKYLFAHAERMSTEAPLPIFEILSMDCRPGGAGNVAANVASLGAEVRLAGLMGCDEDGGRLRGVLTDLGVDIDWVVADPSRPTTTKSRLIAQGKQVVRFDHEVRTEPGDHGGIGGGGGDPLERLRADLEALVDWAEVCVVSDYAKGVVSSDLCRSLLAAAAKRGRAVVVDPKGADYGKYAGADVLTPNLAEALLACRRFETPRTEEEILALGWELLSSCRARAVLITRGAGGMSLITGERGEPECRHIPTRTQEVYDVTGAGDTVAAVLALGLAAGHPLELAADLANHAAGVVVKKLGTALVTPAELLASYASRNGS
jgi:rfaE bifunctional protein kinase chain/domain